MSIMQTDLVLRSAIIQGLKDLRAHPYLLTDIFSQCAQDSLLRDEFGYKEIERAKTWFLKTNIPVTMVYRLDTVEMPCISIALQASTERSPEDVLGDYSAAEELDGTQAFNQRDVTIDPIVVLGPFVPTSYDPATGIITLPQGFDTTFVVAGQFVVDTKSNVAYPIVDVLSDNTFSVAPKTVANFDSAIIIPRFQTLGITRERAIFTESYNIGCHVSGDPAELLWLHSIVVFCLLRYKEAFLDVRGITRTTISSTDMLRRSEYEPQNIYSRYVSVQAVVEHNWISNVARKLEGVSVNKIKIMDGGVTPEGYFEEQVEDQSWEMDGDPDAVVPDTGQDPDTGL